MCVVFIYQLYWLNGLYRTSNSQLEKSIYEALEIADQSEVFLRLEKLEADSTGALQDDYNFDIGVDPNEVSDEAEFEAKKDSGSFSISTQARDKEELASYKNHAISTERLARYMQKGMHQAIDPVLPLNFASLDSLLQAQLLARGIQNSYQLQWLVTANDSVLQSSNELAVGRSFKAYDFTYDMNDAHAYRLWLKNPNKQVVQQMSGMLLTSIVIFGLLIFILIYLMRTIRKLQTEEELKTNFTNNMTHELKTPIAVSYAAVDALLISDGPISPERQRKYLTIAKEQMDYLSGQVELILNMSRKDNKQLELNLEQVDLESTVAALGEKLQLVASKKMTLETDLQVTQVQADKLHLTNMLNNLMENSLKYSGEELTLRVSSRLDGQYVSIAVADNGLGIDPKYQSRLFDKFYRVPMGNQYLEKGFGLGLFYVREMVERHGGTVTVKSQPGKGSVFTLRIPQ